MYRANLTYLSPQDNEGIEKDKKAIHHKENAAGSSELADDSAEKNTIETKAFKNPDLEILPDNLSSKKLDNPNLLSNTFDEGKSLDKDDAKPYSVLDEKNYPGTNNTVINNADEFGWKMAGGAVSISKEGKAYKEGSGKIVNPDNKKKYYLAW